MKRQLSVTHTAEWDGYELATTERRRPLGWGMVTPNRELVLSEDGHTETSRKAELRARTLGSAPAPGVVPPGSRKGCDHARADAGHAHPGPACRGAGDRSGGRIPRRAAAWCRASAADKA
jgi:hypothetical protein